MAKESVTIKTWTKETNEVIHSNAVRVLQFNSKFCFPIFEDGTAVPCVYTEGKKAVVLPVNGKIFFEDTYYEGGTWVKKYQSYENGKIESASKPVIKKPSASIIRILKAIENIPANEVEEVKHELVRLLKVAGVKVL